MEKMQDEKILEWFRLDEEKAFRKLFDCYYMPLCIYAVQMTDSFELSEDLVQDVLLRFWEKKIYQSVTTSLRNYLYIAVRNEVLQYFRHEQQFATEQLDNLSLDIPEQDYAEDTLQERYQQLQQALATLTPQEYQAVKTVVLEKMKYKEAATRLGISVNTLKTYLSRALKRMRGQGTLLLLLY